MGGGEGSDKRPDVKSFEYWWYCISGGMGWGGGGGGGNRTRLARVYIRIETHLHDSISIERSDEFTEKKK